MSKASQKEAAEKKREQEEQRRLKILGAVGHHLDRFSELLPRAADMGPLTETGIEGYVIALGHLSPEQLNRACNEALKVCTFFPKPAEILKAYADWLDGQPSHEGVSRYTEPQRLTPEEQRKAEQLIGKLFAQMSGASWYDGLRWNFADDVEDERKYGRERRENGWRSHEESIRREIARDVLGGKQPHFHVVDKRIAPMREPGEEG